MPFAVFRQHQRKLLAVFAILAMIGFVLSDTLPRWMNSGRAEKDTVVADLFGKKVYRSDLAQVEAQRIRANRFMAFADRSGMGNPNYFGGTSRDELIDALILEREANRLGIPDSAEFARRWVDRETNGVMNAAIFDAILDRFEPKVGGEQLLIDLANQIRIRMARDEIALPIVTPLDVFRNYRDQTEKTSFKVVPILAESFTDKVGDPSDSDVADLYEKYKDVLPDPKSPTPGFKVPRQVKVEYLSIDVNEVARKIKAKLPEEEVKAYYEARKKESKDDEFLMDRELPADLFKGAPELTPVRYIPFALQRDTMADALAREKANEEIQDMFGAIRDEVIDKFADAYREVEDEIAEAKKEGASTEGRTLPKPEDLAGVAKKYGLAHEVTPMLDRREAEHYGRISEAQAGTGRSADTKKFAGVAFDPKTQLFEGFELSEILGERYLVRKIAASPAHVADLKEIRDKVVHAWKLEKARERARKAADELAAKVKADGGQIKDLSIDGKPVIAIDSATKLKPGMSIPPQLMMQYRMQRLPASPTDLPQIPDAGPALIDGLFALKPGEVAVDSDLPKSTYYIMTLEKRDPVSYMALMGPNGSLAGYWSETQMDVMRKAYADGMSRLREQAGFKPEDYPAEEKRRDEDAAE